MEENTVGWTVTDSKNRADDEGEVDRNGDKCGYEAEWSGGQGNEKDEQRRIREHAKNDRPADYKARCRQ